MSKQNKLHKKINDLIKNHLVNDTPCEEMAIEMIDLFREMIPKKRNKIVGKKNIYNTGWDDCHKLTVKNLEGLQCKFPMTLQNFMDF